MARLKLVETARESIRLSVLASSLFPDQAAVRAFVAGEGFLGAMEAVQVALAPFALEELPASYVERAREAAFFLTRDLAQLARIAAAEGAAPAVEDDSAESMTERAASLERILALWGAEELNHGEALEALVQQHLRAHEQMEAELRRRNPEYPD